MRNFSKKIKELFTQYKNSHNFTDNEQVLKLEFLKLVSEIIESDNIHIMDNDQLDDLKTDFYKSMEGLE